MSKATKGAEPLMKGGRESNSNTSAAAKGAKRGTEIGRAKLGRGNTGRRTQFPGA